MDTRAIPKPWKRNSINPSFRCDFDAKGFGLFLRKKISGKAYRLFRFTCADRRTFPDNEEQRRLQSRQSRYAAVLCDSCASSDAIGPLLLPDFRCTLAWLRATILPTFPTRKFDRLIYRVSDRLLAITIISIIIKKKKKETSRLCKMQSIYEIIEELTSELCLKFLLFSSNMNLGRFGKIYIL